MYEHEPDQYLLDLQERDKPTLDNFVVGANGEAVSVLQSGRQAAGPPSCICTVPRGAGLTHLLRSLVPEEGFRVPMFDPKVPLYVVDDVDELDPGWALQLLALQNAVRGTPGMHLRVCGQGARRSASASRSRQKSSGLGTLLCNSPA